MVHSLDEMQSQPCADKTILLVSEILGDEDVPAGCTGVVLLPGNTAPDILSHIAVRARNDLILLAACYNEGIADAIKSASRVVLQPTDDGQDVLVERFA